MEHLITLLSFLSDFSFENLSSMTVYHGTKTLQVYYDVNGYPTRCVNTFSYDDLRDKGIDPREIALIGPESATYHNGAKVS